MSGGGSEEVKAPLRDGSGEAAVVRPQVERSIRRNVAWMVAAKGVHAVTRWSLVAAMAKLGSSEMVGQYVLGVIISLPVFGLMDLQLRGVQATDAREEHPFGLFLALRLITTVLAVVVVTFIALIGYPGATATVLIMVGLHRASESIADVFQGPMQQQERMDQMATSIIARGVLGSIATIAVIATTGSLSGSVAAMMVMSVVVLVLFDRPKVASLSDRRGRPLNIGPLWDRRALASLAWMALPLGVIMMLVALQFNIPRYVLENWHGTAALGILAGIAYFLDAGRQLVLAIGTSVSPRLARHFSQGKRREFFTLLFKLMAVCMVPAIIGLLASILAGPFFLRLLLSEEYVPYVDIFRILMFAAVLGFAACASGYGMMATRKFGRSLIPFVISVSWSIFISWLLIPTHGIQGAAWALVTVCGATLVMPMLLIVTVRWPPLLVPVTMATASSVAASADAATGLPQVKEA